MLFGSIRPNVRSKALALAGLAVAPWPSSWLLLDEPNAIVVGLSAAASLAACWMLVRLLSPLVQASRELAQLMRADGAEPDLFDDVDDLGAIVRSVAHLKERVHSLQHRWVRRHGLSGLPVRESLARAMTEDIHDSAQPVLLGAIRFADFDRLSQFDPATADGALKCFAERLAGSLGKGRPMAHVDRDSFAIWFRHTAPEAAAVELQALCYALGAEIAAGDMTVVPEVEVGAAIYPSDAAEPTALINHALVSVARPGADRGAIAPPGKSVHIARERFALQQDLRHAIARDQLDMVFQPVVEMGRGVIGAEALLRWRHPEAGMISPSRFIPILEDADLIDEIGRWTLNVACREMRRWQQKGLRDLRVAVNLSAAQLRDPELKTMIERTLARHRISARSLELELTETAATEDAERTFALFRDLRALGIRLAIDDFGSGYSSLSYLKNLPFDKLKIDREFVVDVHRRKNSQAICGSLVALTRGLGLQILAEGVESWEEVEMMRRLGCNTFQGFLFSEPLNSDQFIEIALDPQWRQALRKLPPGPEEADVKRMSA